MKSILIWNSVDRIETGYFNVGSSSFKEKCSVSQCRIFTEHTALPFQQFDAVVMNMFDVHSGPLPEVEGFNRSSHQRYVFLQLESPKVSPLDVSIYLNYFNWTMTYKLNSDIRLTYGRVKAKSSAPKNGSDVLKWIRSTRSWNKNYLATKKKKVAWMSSHCKTDALRETYIAEMKKYIDVDVMGACGKVKFACPRDRHWYPSPICFERIAADYKFYLSFENSLCDDYATEKFFYALAHDVVPVVYGGFNYNKVAPPHSYIDALQYTPKQMARYLNRIDRDDRLYNEFFWWKEHFQVETGIEQMLTDGYCELCKKLHEDSTVKVYDGIATFWNNTQCKTVGPWNNTGKTEENDSEKKKLGWRKV